MALNVVDWLVSLITLGSHLPDVFFALGIIISVRIVRKEGWGGLLRRCLSFIRLFPGVDKLITWLLRSQIKPFLRQIDHSTGTSTTRKKAVAIPEKGIPQDELLEELKVRKKVQVDPHTGKIFAYVYTTEDERFETVQKAYEMFDANLGKASGEDTMLTTPASTSEREKKEAIVQMFFNAFIHDNALNPMVFPSLRQFEVETVAMVANMLSGDAEVVGSVTSGGTESILMAVKTYRDRARSLFPKIRHPQIVAPRTVHPAFEKAASYFDVEIVHVPLNGYQVDMEAYRKAITPNTILLVGSAPEYAHGMVDPLEDISRIAMDMGLPMHVDACFGGFILPWVEKLGYRVPAFDFRLPGVTSMTADIHKYGLGVKGASVVMYRNKEIRKYQIFAYAEWPGGLFGSPSMAGTRPGGNLASSWAVLRVMGQDGYMDVARNLMDVAQQMKDGIATIEGLNICGNPTVSAFSITSSEPGVDIFAVADVMETKGWKIERQMQSLHFSVLPSHTTESAQELVEDLKSAVATVRQNPQLSKKGSAGMYGMVGSIPDKAVVKEFIVEFFNEVYTV